jgi:hypothetical protein
MELVLVIAFLLAIGPLALLYGIDSRTWDDRDDRGWWPGVRRSH